MSTQIRRLTCVSEHQMQALADLLIDCVDGGASVSFMQPLSMQNALAFWRGAAEGVARTNERSASSSARAPAILTISNHPSAIRRTGREFMTAS